MIYVALLRGINVGGKNTVSMKELVSAYEAAGLQNVSSYINSGNIIFSDTTYTASELAAILEAATKTATGLQLKILVRDMPSISAIVSSLPSEWRNDSTMKCDVLFLWQDIDSPASLDLCRFNSQIEDSKYLPGAILWRIDRPNVTKSAVLKLVGTPTYANMTIRNCNTVRTLYGKMTELEKSLAEA